MNLRDLHYVLRVAETGNFKRAADLCHVSQPTLSMQIKKMEEYLGIQLFERTHKSVMLTEAGKRIIAIAGPMIEGEAQIHALARAIRDPRAGTFRLGAIPTLASYVFPRFMPRLKTVFPAMQLLLIEEKTENLLTQLKTGKSDAALLALPIDEPSLESAPLLNDEFLLAVAPGHALARHKNIQLNSLLGHSLLLLDEGHCLRDQALSVCHAHGAEEDATFRATSLETLRVMVQSDANLMTLMPAIAATPAPALRYIPFTDPAPSRTIGLVWRKTSARGEVMREMAAIMRESKGI